MISKEFMIKKLQAQIKENKKISKFLQTELQNKEFEKNHDENFIMDTMHMLVCNEAEIHVYKDLIKKIKKGEFDNNNLLN